MGIHPIDHTADIVTDDRVFIKGMYPEVVGIEGALTPRDGSLRLTRVAESEPGTTPLGTISTTSLVYGDGKKEDVLYFHITLYHEMEAAAAAVEYNGDMNLHPGEGLRVVIGDIPSFIRGMGAERHKPHWTRPAFASSPGDFPRHTQYIVWRDGNDRWGAAIPLVGGGLKTSFSPRGNRLSAGLASYDSGFRPDVVPVFAAAWGPDPYDTTRRLYKVGFDFMGTPGQLRTEKQYPRIFEHFGWCSWNAFYSGVRMKDIVDAAASFRDNGFPLRYILVDDGWQDLGDDESRRKLHSFDANDKFPGGMKALADELKNDYGISWVGVWHTFQGYWNGVAAGSPIEKEHGSSMLQSLSGNLFPDPRRRRGLHFFNAYHEKLAASGIDFVKVDNQSSAHSYTVHLMPISYASLGWQQNLQMSVEKNFDNAVINCMGMTIENIYYWAMSNIARSSDDFFPDVPGNARHHVVHNIYNSMWFSELAWPDFDMFQSHHPHAEMHAVLRAVSAGPVYVTDTPGRQNWPLLRKLTFSDGALPRADEPPRPTRDSLVAAPSAGAVPLKAFTRSGDTGVLAAFNVLESGGGVTGVVSPSDIEYLEGDRFAVYEHFTGELHFMRHGGRLPVSIPEFGARLYTVAPIIDGAAPIGLLDKYLSAAAITSKLYEDDSLVVGLRDGGEFGAWLEAEPAAVVDQLSGASYTPGDWTFKNHFFRLHIDSAGPVELKIFTRRKGCNCDKDSDCE